jgi:hypothetical protein
METSTFVEKLENLRRFKSHHLRLKGHCKTYIRIVNTPKTLTLMMATAMFVETFENLSYFKSRLRPQLMGHCNIYIRTFNTPEDIKTENGNCNVCRNVWKPFQSRLHVRFCRDNCNTSFTLWLIQVCEMETGRTGYYGNWTRQKMKR